MVAHRASRTGRTSDRDVPRACGRHLGTRQVPAVLSDRARPRLVARMAGSAICPVKWHITTTDATTERNDMKPMRKMLAAATLAVALTTGMTVALNPAAAAGTTLRPSAAEKGRYFGAAVAAYKLCDRVYTDDPEP